MDEGRRREALQRQHADLVSELELERKELASVQGLVQARCRCSVAVAGPGRSASRH